MAIQFNSNHPNFKHIVKNRRIPNDGYGYWYCIIKNEMGEIWNNGEKQFQTKPNEWFKYYNGSEIVFSNAKENGGHVYLRTIAGDIPIFEKDFQ